MGWTWNNGPRAPRAAAGEARSGRECQLTISCYVFRVYLQSFAHRQMRSTRLIHVHVQRSHVNTEHRHRPTGSNRRRYSSTDTRTSNLLIGSIGSHLHTLGAHTRTGDAAREPPRSGPQSWASLRMTRPPAWPAPHSGRCARFLAARCRPVGGGLIAFAKFTGGCLLYTSPSPRDRG